MADEAMKIQMISSLISIDFHVRSHITLAKRWRYPHTTENKGRPGHLLSNSAPPKSKADSIAICDCTSRRKACSYLPQLALID
jgi:hypothetical protein